MEILNEEKWNEILNIKDKEKIESRILTALFFYLKMKKSLPVEEITEDIDKIHNFIEVNNINVFYLKSFLYELEEIVEDRNVKYDS